MTTDVLQAPQTRTPDPGGPRPPTPRRRPSLIQIGLLTVGSLLLGVSVMGFSIHMRNNRYLREATAFIFDRPGSIESKAIALARFVSLQGRTAIQPDSASLVARLEHSLPLEISPVTVLKEGFAFPDAHRFGPCGQLSRTIRAVAWLHQIPSQKVLIGEGAKEHAMVALWFDGAYRLFDPTFDFYWTDSTGHVASIDLVRSDPAVFAQIYRKVPHYPYRLEGSTYFRWARLGPVGKWLQKTLGAIFGRRWVESIGTPKLYERPWWGYAWTSLMGAAACFGLTMAIGRRRRTPGTRPGTA